MILFSSKNTYKQIYDVVSNLNIEGNTKKSIQKPPIYLDILTVLSLESGKVTFLENF